MVTLFDRDLRCRLLDGAYLRERDLDPADFVGRHLSEIQPGEAYAVLEPILRGAVDGVRGSVTYVSSLTRRRLTLDAAPHRDRHGAVVGAIAVARDVTVEREAEERRIEAEDRFETAFDRAPIGMCIVGFDGTYLRVNDAMAELTGYPCDEMQGMTVFELSHPDDIAEARAGCERATRGLSHAAEKRYLRADGSQVWVEVETNVIHDVQGRPLYMLAQIRDVTAQRERLEQRAEEVRRLEELDRAKDEFVSFVSHELRTPLTSVQGYLEVLLDEAEGMSEEHQRFLATIQRNALRLNRLVTDLLDLTRSDVGVLVLERDEVDLPELVRQAVEGIEPAAATAGLRLDLDVVAVLPLFGDGVRLAQVIDNVVGNAVKYTPDGGTVEVRLTERDGHAVLRISDTGIGIPAAERERLFERFFRASTATDQNIAGTGLGLAISKTIIEAHGGTIAAHPREPRGTTFSVELPLTGAPGPGTSRTPRRQLAAH